MGLGRGWNEAGSVTGNCGWKGYWKGAGPGAENGAGKGAERGLDGAGRGLERGWKGERGWKAAGQGAGKGLARALEMGLERGWERGWEMVLNRGGKVKNQRRLHGLERGRTGSGLQAEIGRGGDSQARIERVLEQKLQRGLRYAGEA